MARHHMSGPEHYREAERLTALGGNSADPTDAAIVLTEAQAHATLALAAATALASTTNRAVSRPDVRQWVSITTPGKEAA